MIGLLYTNICITLDKILYYENMISVCRCDVEVSV